MKFAFKIIILFALLLASPFAIEVLQAQPLPPAGSSNIPIDGGALAVLIAGAGLAIRKYLKSEA